MTGHARSHFGAGAAALLLWLGSAACADGPTTDGDADLPEIEDLPWPGEPEPLPPCTPALEGFVAPEVEPASGPVVLTLSSPLQPLGVEVRVAVEVRRSDTEEVDTGFAGEVLLETGPGAVLLGVGAIEAGRAEAWVRFDQPGLHTLAGTLTGGDDRDGHAQVWAYEPQLPVWEITVRPEDFDSIVEHPDEELEVPASLAIGDEELEATMRLHGGSSRYYPKKSFRIDLASGLDLPDGSDHLILRAEWNDKSLLRNYLASELIRNGSWLPASAVELVHLRINGEFYGLMSHVQRVDADFLRAHDLTTNASLYEADPPIEHAAPGGNLTPLATEEDYRSVYQHHLGTIDYDDLIDLVDALQLPDEQLDPLLDELVVVDDVLVYLAAMAVIQGQDHIRKNYYLYRALEGEDQRWRVFPWDLDLTFGHLWTEENDVLDEAIFTDGPIFFGERVPEHDFQNQLTTRLLGVPRYRSRFVALVHHIAGRTLTPGFVDERIDNALCRATPEILADVRKRATNDEYLARVDELRAFVAARAAFIEAQE